MVPHDPPILLYAEDDGSTREVVQLMLNRRFPGMVIHAADNGRKGLDLYHDVRPDIVLADMKMPVMDGITMAQEIRKHDQRTRIIITTANTDTNRILEAIDVGINNYVLKPINQVKLFASIEQCISGIKLEKELAQQREHIHKLSHAVEQSPVAIMMIDTSGLIEYVNPRFMELTGYQQEEAVGRNGGFFHANQGTLQEEDQLWQVIASGREWRGEFRCRKKNGELYWASASISPLVDEQGTTTRFIYFHEDITERKQAEETIKQMAYFDALTGLPNRHLFNELLHQAMAQAHRENRILAILFLDLDRFKIINDTLGHAIGDQLLQAAAQRLKKSCRRERDTVARRGGDEFIILLPELVDVQEAVRVAQNIIESFSSVFVLPDHEVFISTCVGISIFPHDGIEPETLIKNADMALVEETGLISSLGEWVLRTACLQNKEWQKKGFPPMRVSVNCSPRQFQQLNLTHIVEQALGDSDLDPEWLELEVTENLMMQNEESAMLTLRHLNDLGVSITIDDFGTGYSSLSAIRKLPITTLKIDKSFISDINTNSDDAAIAKAVITMAQSLRLAVVAEGVETKEQMKLLDSLHCHFMQGYYFSRPLPAADLGDLLGRWTWTGLPTAYA